MGTPFQPTWTQPATPGSLSQNYNPAVETLKLNVANSSGTADPVGLLAVTGTRTLDSVPVWETGYIGTPTTSYPALGALGVGTGACMYQVPNTTSMVFAGGSGSGAGLPLGNSFSATSANGGSISPWLSYGAQFANNAVQFSAIDSATAMATINGTNWLYSCGGTAGTGVGTRAGVVRIAVNADGSPAGPPITDIPLPAAIGGAACCISQTYVTNTAAGTTGTMPLPYIYVMGGTVHAGGAGSQGVIQTGAVSTVYYSAINSDGSLSGWTTNTALGGPIQLGSAVAMGGYIFINPGVTDAGAIATIQVATINSSTGTLGTFTAISSQPATPVYAAPLVGIYENNIFKLVLVGGKNAAGTAQTQVAYTYMSPGSGNVTSNTFFTTTALPVADYDGQAVLGPLSHGQNALYYAHGNGTLYSLRLNAAQQVGFTATGGWVSGTGSALTAGSLGTGGTLAAEGNGSQDFSFGYQAFPGSPPITSIVSATGDQITLTADVVSQKGYAAPTSSQTAVDFGDAPTINSITSDSSASTITTGKPTLAFSYGQGTGAQSQASWRIQLTSANLLSANQASIETDATAWTNTTNCSITQSNVQALYGSFSLRLSSTAGGTMAATTAASVPATAATTYTAVASFRTAVSARSCTIGINWLNAAGGTISTTTGSTVADTTSGFTQVFVSGAAPALTVAMTIVGTVQSTGGAAEIHFMDGISVAATAATNLGWDQGTKYDTGTVNGTLNSVTADPALYGAGPIQNNAPYIVSCTATSLDTPYPGSTNTKTTTASMVSLIAAPQAPTAFSTTPQNTSASMLMSITNSSASIIAAPTISAITSLTQDALATSTLTTGNPYWLAVEYVDTAGGRTGMFLDSSSVTISGNGHNITFTLVFNGGATKARLYLLKSASQPALTSMVSLGTVTQGSTTVVYDGTNASGITAAVSGGNLNIILATVGNATGLTSLTTPTISYPNTNNIYYRVNGTTPWILLKRFSPGTTIGAAAANTSAGNPVIPGAVTWTQFDQLALNQAYDFAVSAVSANNVETFQVLPDLSNSIVPVTGNLQTTYSAYLHIAGNGSSYNMPLIVDESPKYTQDIDMNSVLTFSQAAPSARYGTGNYLLIDAQVMLPSTTLYTQLTTLLAQAQSSGSPLYFRDSYSNVIVCVPDASQTKSYLPPTFGQFNLKLTQTNYTYVP